MSNPIKLPAGAVKFFGAGFDQLPTDPLFLSGQQWHLNNPSYPASDMNVQAVWDDYRGGGITIGIIDDGVEYTHPDLAANSAPFLGANFVTADIGAPSNGAAYLSSDRHGTQVAGVIAADDNAIGGVGVAPDATIAGLRIGFGPSGSLDQINGAFTAAKNFDIINNSWSYGGFFFDNFSDADSFGAGLNPFFAINDALIAAVDEGRGGLGTVFTFAAGNDRASGQDVNYHGFQGSPHTITVAGHTKFDADYSASTPGAAVLVSGPGQSVRTTDREGSAGSSSGDSVQVSGTSFAAPAVAGVVALMLDANPNLGYRDVQEILTLSSKLADPASNAWAINGSGNWNGGGRHVSHELGFGAVDAFNAVRLAETWTMQATFGNLMTGTATQNFGGNVGLASPIVATMTVADIPFDLDQVVVNVDMVHGYIGDLIVSLESPSGTVSTLMNRPGFGAATASVGINEFGFTSVQYWDEAIAGDWTLTIQDAGSGGTGFVSGWSLDFLGDLDTGDDTYFYTGEWANYGAESARQTIIDTGGTDTLNFAAIAEAVTFSLGAGSTNTLLGHGLAIDAATVIENAVGGDGNDSLTGNASDNHLRGMRGDDELEGGAGNDLIDGGSGQDTAVFSRVRADYHVTSNPAGGYTVAANAGSDGTDTLTGIEFVAFADGTFSIADLLTPPPAPDPAPTPAIPEPTITGTATGGETVSGTGGDDVLATGGGLWDKLAGGAGDDSYIVEIGQTTVAEAYGGGHDTVYSRADFLAVFSEVETFVLLDGAGGLLANRYDNHITGNAGANDLSGGGGGDTILGMGGDDLLNGGIGNDTLDGGEGTDTALYAGILGGFDIVENADGSLTVTDLVGDEGADTLLRVEYLQFADQTIAAPNTIPNPGDEPTAPPPTSPDPAPEPDPTPAIPEPTITGTATGGETVSGTGGDDVLATGGGLWDKLAGGAGDDSYIVEIGQTTVAEAYGGGHDTVYSRADFLAVFSEVETFVLLDGAGGLLANRYDNHITGNAGANDLSGGAGDDTILGMGGDDLLNGGIGNDMLDGGEGVDTAVYSGAATDYTVTYLPDGLTAQVTDTVGSEGTDLLTSIEYLRFSDGDVAVNFPSTPAIAEATVESAQAFAFDSDTAFT